MVVADRKKKVNCIRDEANARLRRQCLVIGYVVD